MFRKASFVLILFCGVLMLASCDPLAKLTRSSSIADKDTAATRYFRKGKYEQAVFLLEELSAVYRGTPRHRDIYYQYAWCKYYLGEYISSAFYFDDFARQ